MCPTIKDRDYVLASKYKNAPVNGSVAVIGHTLLGRLIKRINVIRGIGKFVASGDNDLSIESPTIGVLEEHEIKYQARWRISPTGIARLRTLDTPPI